MRASLRITGPDLNRQVALDPSGAEATLGRDPAADVQLPDPQKHISRKHLAVRQVGDTVEVRIVSELNGIETSRGPVPAGQSVTLKVGEQFTLGPYSAEVVMGAPEGPRQPAPSPFTADDPFAALLGPRAAMPQSDDPFARPEFRPAAAPSRGPSSDPFEQLTGGARKSGAGGPLGDLLGPGRSLDGPLGDPGALVDSPGQFPGDQRLNDWLGGGPAKALSSVVVPAGPLDAFLGRSNVQQMSKALSPDHVHGIHMPVSFRSGGGAVALPVPAAPPAPALNDPWDNLLQNPSAPESVGRALSDFPAAATENPFDDDWAGIGFPAANASDHAVDVEPPRVEATPPSTSPLVNPPGASLPDQSDAWSGFARGLGLPETYPADAASAERAGAMVRVLIEGVAELLGARADLKRELRAEERTMLSGRDNNPLKAKLSAADLVQYLFAAQTTGGYMPAERAIRESIAELRVHEHATIAASRAAVEGALRDFEPGRLRKQLAQGKPGIFQVFDNARLWEAYEQHYEKRGQHMADWLESVFSRHFMPTYSRETERQKAEGNDAPAA